MIWQLVKYMRRADAIHVRCPCDLGLLGVLLAPIFSRRLYASTRTLARLPGEPGRGGYNVLCCDRDGGMDRSRCMVSGQSSGNVVRFSLDADDEQISRARSCEKPSETLRVLFVGRLTKSKNVDVILKASRL